MLSSRHKGNIAVAAAMTYFASRGYALFLPVGDTGGAIDLIVSCDGMQLNRVQCKYTAQKQRNYPKDPGRTRRKYTRRKERGEIRARPPIWEVALHEHRRPLKGSTQWGQHYYHRLSFDILFVQTPESTYVIPWNDVWHQWREPGSDTVKKRILKLGQTMDQYCLKGPLIADPSFAQVSHMRGAMLF